MSQVLSDETFHTLILSQYSDIDVDTASLLSFIFPS